MGPFIWHLRINRARRMARKPPHPFNIDTTLFSNFAGSAPRRSLLIVVAINKILVVHLGRLDGGLLAGQTWYLDEEQNAPLIDNVSDSIPLGFGIACRHHGRELGFLSLWSRLYKFLHLISHNWAAERIYDKRSKTGRLKSVRYLSRHRAKTWLHSTSRQQIWGSLLTVVFQHVFAQYLFRTTTHVVSWLLDHSRCLILISMISDVSSRLQDFIWHDFEAIWH